MSIPQMSLSAAILIIMIIPIRSLTVHKLPKLTFVALWAVVLCRLLIPFSVTPPFNIYGAADTAAAFFTAAFDRLNALLNYNPARGANAFYYLAENGARVIPAGVAWITGAAVCALFFLIAHLRCRREYKMTLPLENEYIGEWLRAQKTRRSVQVRYSDRFGAPLTYGIRKPVILFPKTNDWRNEERLRYILTHEMTHIRRFDIVLKWLLAAALCVHWFNPFVWVMYVLANRDIELSCDEAVVRAFGEAAKSNYALALINSAEIRSGFFSLSNNFSLNAARERINAIMRIKKRTLAGMLSAAAIVAALSAGALTLSAPARETYSSGIYVVLSESVISESVIRGVMAERDLRLGNMYNAGENSNIAYIIYVDPQDDTASQPELLENRFIVAAEGK